MAALWEWPAVAPTATRPGLSYSGGSGGAEGVAARVAAPGAFNGRPPLAVESVPALHKD
jgi:hypothetical protein